VANGTPFIFSAVELPETRHLVRLVLIRTLVERDIDYVTESVNAEKWGYDRRDIERCWRYEPDGCFVAEIDNIPIGHVFSICYGKIGWIGLLRVDPEHRRRRIGRDLMRVTLNYQQGAGAEAIRLVARDEAVPLYLSLGFREEFEVIRFSRQIRRADSVNVDKQAWISQMRQKDIEDLAKFDCKYFGASRVCVLRSLYKDEPRLCFLAREGTRLLGYVMARRIRDAYYAGPWVCENPERAEDLLCACIGAVSEETELRLDMGSLNENGTGLMRKLGFHVMGTTISMVWGERKHGGNSAGIYGIGGREKG
jgi:ribosomal protein S18 acetylase RimI-like enzyme